MPNKKNNYIEEVIYHGDVQNFTFNNTNTSDSSDSSDSENESTKVEIKQENKIRKVSAECGMAIGCSTVYGKNSFFVNGEAVKIQKTPPGNVHVDQGIAIGEFSNGGPTAEKQSIVIGKPSVVSHATHFKTPIKHERTNLVEKQPDQDNCKACTIV